MTGAVNLIPQEEKKEQSKQKAVRTSTFVTIILFIVVASIGGYLYYKTYQLQNEITAKEASIDSLRSDITNLSDIEVSARNLSKRYNTLKSILDVRKYNSVLLEELEKRVPDTVKIESFGIGREAGTINITGVGDDYISIAQFVNNLSDSESSVAGEGLGALFPEVTLKSVNLDLQTNKARFFVVVRVDGSLLTK